MGDAEEQRKRNNMSTLFSVHCTHSHGLRKAHSQTHRAKKKKKEKGKYRIK